MAEKSKRGGSRTAIQKKFPFNREQQFDEYYDALFDEIQALFESCGIEGNVVDLWNDTDAWRKLALWLAFDAKKRNRPDAVNVESWYRLWVKLIRQTGSLAPKFRDLPLKWQLATKLAVDGHRQKRPYGDVGWIKRQNLHAASRDAWLYFEYKRLDNASAAAKILAEEQQQSKDWLRQHIYDIRREGPSRMMEFCSNVIRADMAAGRQYQKNRVDRVAEVMEEAVDEAILLIQENFQNWL